MPPLYIKPENALKRSEELLALSTPQSKEQAFENLFEVFQSKRFKMTPIATLEPIVLKFLDLCVELQRRSHARFALLSYRNAIQTTNSGSVENALNHFIAEAESRLTKATEQAKSEVAALPENPTVDDELPLQPSAMLLDTFIDNTNDRERIERRLIAPAQKFCYDAYDTSLDICKGNDRLELVYQSIAHRAFNFCKVHQRKTDFRRLCEQRLRKDLANASKYGHQQHAINLADPETLSRHLDTRFLQLETAVELELWQEAFRSVEDVHGLVAGKKQAKPAMMANYYEKLTQIFKAEGGKQTAVFHAAAWARYLQYAERAGQTPEKAPGCVLLSALAVPLGDVETKQRLIALLNLPKMPTRDALVKDAAAKHLRRVHPAIRQIYNALEVDFQPLKAAKTLAPIIASLPADYQPYLPALREVVLSRLLTGLSEVYDTVSLSHVISLVQPFESTAWKTDMPSLEKFLMTSARRGEINASIDHVAKSLTFTAPSIDTNRLSNLAVCLYNTIQYLNPAPTPSRSDAFTAAIAQAEEERKQAQHRRQIVIKRRELLEEANIRRVKEESTAKAERAKQLAEETARKEKEYSRQADLDRLQKQMEATRREEAKKLAESLQAKGALKVDMKAIEDLDSNQVLALQVQQLDKEKREMADRLRIVGKRVDHLERAMRKEERPLLVQDYERQKEDDKVAHEELNKVAREMAVQRQAAERDLKERLGRMMPDYMQARKEVESQHMVEFEKAREEAQRKVAEEKEKFRAKVMERRKKDKERRERERQEDEERERAEQEQADAEARAEAERESAEAEAKAAIEQRNAEATAAADARRKARDAERAEADEAAKKQRAREEEAEQRRAQRAAGANAPTRAAPTIHTPAPAAVGITPSLPRTEIKAGGWREKAAAKAAAGGAGGSSTPQAPTSPAPTRQNGTSSPAPAPSAPARSESPAVAANGQGEDKAPARGVYQPGRGSWSARRGGATGGGAGGGTPPPSSSTRGGASGGGGSRW